ncbi:MAG: hypothetical protein ACRDRS_25115 [Pseudonocardiaceae bacterium]
MEKIDTVGDLIAALECYDPDTPIRLASQRHWPFEYTLGGVALTPDDAEGDGTEPTGDPVVWIAEGRQVDYLPGTARSALGWSR